MNPITQQKVQQAAGILAEFGIDAWLTFVRETSAAGDPVLPLIYGADSLTWQSALLITRSGESIAIVGALEAHAAQVTGAYTRVIPYDTSIRQALREVLSQLNPAKLAVNTSKTNVMADGLTFGMYQVLQDLLEGTPFISRMCSAEMVISALRGRKTPTEQDLIRTAVEITEDLLHKTFNFAQVGQSEKDIADFMHRRLAEAGLETGWSYDGCPIVNAGPDSPVGHAVPGDLRIKPGQILHIDFGVRHKGYCSDLQRVAYFHAQGEKQPPEAVQHGFAVVSGAIQAAFKAVKPGIPGHQVDAIARQAVINAGYPEFMYALGHQVGREAHDGGGLLGPHWEKYGASPDMLIEAGQIYTLEPGLMVPGYGYLGLEEDILVTPHGAEFISHPQTQLIFK